MKRPTSFLVSAILLVVLGLNWSTKLAEGLPLEGLDDVSGGSSLTSQEESGSSERFSRRKLNKFREGIVTVPPILASEWGLALVDGVTIRQILEEEENDIGISFDELSLLQQEFGKRTDKNKKRKGVEGIFNAPGAQVVTTNTDSQKTRKRPSKNKSTLSIGSVEEVTRPTNFLRAIDQSANENKAGDGVEKQPTATTVAQVTEPSSTTTTERITTTTEQITTTTEVPRTTAFPRRRTTTSRLPATLPFEESTTLPPFTTVTEAFASTTAPQTTERSTTQLPNTESSSFTSELTPSSFARSSLAPIAFAPTTEAAVSTTTQEPTITTSSTENPNETDYPDEEEDLESISEATIANSFESVKSSSGSKTRSRSTTQAPVTTSSVPSTTLADDPVQTTRNEIQSSTTTEAPRPLSSTTALPFKIFTESPINPADGTSRPIVFTIVTPQKTTVTITKTPPPSPATVAAITAQPASTTARPVTTTSSFSPLLFSRSRTRPLNLTALTRGRVRNNQGASVSVDIPTTAQTTTQEPRLDRTRGRVRNNQGAPINVNIPVAAETTTQGPRPEQDDTDGENEPATLEELRVTSAASDEDNLSFKRIKPVSNKIFNTVTDPTTTTSTTTETITTTSEQPITTVPSTTTTEVPTESSSTDNQDDSGITTTTTEAITVPTLNGNRRVGGRRPGTRKRVQDKASSSNTEVTSTTETVTSQAPSIKEEDDLNETPIPEELQVTAAAKDEDNVSFKRIKQANNKLISTVAEISVSTTEKPTEAPTSTETSTDPVEVKEEAVSSTTTDAPSTTTTQSPSSRRTAGRRVGGRRPVSTTEANVITLTEETASTQEFGGRRPFSSRRRTTTTAKPDEVPAVENRVDEPTARPILPIGSRRRTTTPLPVTQQTESQREERVTLRPPRRRTSTTGTTTPTTVEASTANFIASEAISEEPGTTEPSLIENSFGERATVEVEEKNSTESLNVPAGSITSTEATSEAPETSTSERPASSGIPSLFSSRRRTSTTTTTTSSPVSEASGSNQGALQALLSGRRRTTAATSTQNPPTTVSANTVVIGRRRPTTPLSTTTTPSSTTTTTAPSVSEALAGLAVEEDTTDAPSTDAPVSSSESAPSSTISTLESLLGRRPGRRRLDVTGSNQAIADASTEAPVNPSSNSPLIRRPSIRTTTTEASTSESAPNGIANLISARRPGGRRTTPASPDSESSPTEAPSGSTTSGLAGILARRPSIRTTTARSTEETSSQAPPELRRVVPSRNPGNRFRPNGTTTTTTTTIAPNDSSTEVDSTSVRTTRVLRPSFLNRAGQAAETSTADPGITPDQVQQIRDRIRSRGRKIVASPVTIVVNDVSTPSTSTTTEPSTSALPEVIEVASEQSTAASVPSATTEQPVAVAVPNAISELSIPPGVTEDPSGEFSLFPEGAIVLGVSSATEISEVIEIVNFNQKDSA